VPKNQKGWLNQPLSVTNITTASHCQTPSGHIPADEPEQGIDGYARKDHISCAIQQ